MLIKRLHRFTPSAAASASGFGVPAIEVTDGAAGRTIALRGELDVWSAPMCEEDLAAATLGTSGLIRFDVSGLAFVDCAGLDAIDAAVREARSRGCTVAVVGHQQAVARLAALYAPHLLDAGVATTA